MKYILEGFGKTVDCFTTHKPSVLFDWIEDIGVIKTAVDYDYRYDGLIFVDFTDYVRIQDLTLGHEEWFDSHEKIIIDHHETIVQTPKTIGYIVPSIASTCELLYEIWSCIDSSVITPQVATSLYLGLTTDTANYIHDGNSTQTLERGLALIKLGANKKLVQDKMLRSYSLGSLHFLSKFLGRITETVGIYYGYYTDDDLVQCGIDREEGEIATIMLQSIKHCDVVVIFKIKGDMIYFSLRSRNTAIDHIARYYGGGGHRYASGGARASYIQGLTLEGNLAAIVQEIAGMLTSSVI